MYVCVYACTHVCMYVCMCFKTFNAACCRNILQPGRVLLPMDDKAHTATWQVWRNTDLLKKGCVTECEMNQDFITIEDLAEDAAPTSTQEYFQVSRPEKVQQIGSSATQQLLKSALTGVTARNGGKPVTLLVDLTMHTCDLGKGFLQEHFAGTANQHMYYLGFAENETEAWRIF